MFGNLAYKSSSKGLSLPTRLHSLQSTGRRHRFRCNVPIDFSSRNFRVRTINSFQDFLKVLELRHLVFQKEFAGKKFCLRSDRDKYDRNADFLVVEDTEADEVVGCYRMICSDYSDNYYSSSEFDISVLENSNKTIVELSRAAILKDYRNGRVISLLWRGIAAYMNATKADLLFGCGSIQTLEEREIEAYSQMFRDQGVLSEDLYFQAKKKFKLVKERESSGQQALPDVMVPALMRTYIKAGARICSEPALDRKFKCTDYLIVLENSKLNQSFREKYVVS